MVKPYVGNDRDQGEPLSVYDEAVVLFDRFEPLNALVLEHNPRVPVTFLSQLKQARFAGLVDQEVVEDETVNVFVIPEADLGEIGTWVDSNLVPEGSSVQAFSMWYDFSETVELATPRVKCVAEIQFDPELFPVLEVVSPSLLRREISYSITDYRMPENPDSVRLLKMVFVDLNRHVVAHGITRANLVAIHQELARLNAALLDVDESLGIRNPWEISRRDIEMLQLFARLTESITQ